jgi:very-short-patch-repair endonuclease
MGTNGATSASPLARLAAVAAGQLGLVTLEQARECGLADRTITRRVGDGTLRRVQPGVLAAGGSPRTWEQALLAGCLATGGVASHESAAQLHRVEYVARERRVVTVGRGGTRNLRGIDSHESSEIGHHWRTRVGPIPVTIPARTIVDLAAVLHPVQLEHALDDALGRGAVTIDECIAAFDSLACRGRTGIVELRRLLSARGTGRVADTTELERMFSALVRRCGLPEPDRQVLVGRERLLGTVDFVYRARRLIVEVDGRLGHSQVLDFEKDRRRDQEALVSGYRVVRFTYRQITRRPHEVEAVLTALLVD